MGAAISAAMGAALGGCRERELGPGEAGGGLAGAMTAGPQAAAASHPARLLYPNAPSSFVDLVDSARGSVVAIRSTTPVKSGPAAMYPGSPEATADVALGTGFLVEAGGVFVLTNDHIAAAATELQIATVDGQVLAAKVIGRDVRLDLALLKVDALARPPGTSAGTGSAGAAPPVAPVAPLRLHALPLGNSDELAVGEWVVALGNPFGDEVTASAGIISATGRDAAGSLVPGRAMGYRTYLQTDAHLHRGNSGGPVLDTAGQVIGVAVAAGDRPGELAFVIPINRVKEIVGALRDFGQVSRGWLGVYVKPVTAELAQTLGVAPVDGQRTGAVITGVQSGSPAARSALHTGDVILKWGDRPVDHRSLPWIVAQTPVGQPVTVTIWRSGALQELPLVTEKMPE